MEPKLNNLPPVMRLWFTLFLIAVLLGLAAAIGQHAIITGLDPAKTAAYYRGGEVGGAIQVEKPVQDMFRVAHTHLFATGLLLFVLCRIFAMSPTFDRVKMLFITAAFGSLFLQVSVPWLVRFAGAAFAPLLGVSVMLLGLVVFTMVMLSLYFMWCRK